ncbi:MAG: uL13 family ribosomal protein [Patescibacteria group bacterium]
MEPTTHTIDAKGKKLGRLATQVAHLLMEKDSPAFQKHKKNGARVHVTNASKIVFTEKRTDEVRYKRASGYAGHFVEETIEQLKGRRGIGEVVRRAVKGMIPDNKLRPDILKRLEISE